MSQRAVSGSVAVMVKPALVPGELVSATPCLTGFTDDAIVPIRASL